MCGLLFLLHEKGFAWATKEMHLCHTQCAAILRLPAAHRHTFAAGVEPDLTVYVLEGEDWDAAVVKEQQAMASLRPDFGIGGFDLGAFNSMWEGAAGGGTSAQCKQLAHFLPLNWTPKAPGSGQQAQGGSSPTHTGTGSSGSGATTHPAPLFAAFLATGVDEEQYAARQRAAAAYRGSKAQALVRFAAPTIRRLLGQGGIALKLLQGVLALMDRNHAVSARLAEPMYSAYLTAAYSAQQAAPQAAQLQQHLTAMREVEQQLEGTCQRLDALRPQPLTLNELQSHARSVHKGWR